MYNSLITKAFLCFRSFWRISSFRSVLIKCDNVTARHLRPPCLVLTFYNFLNSLTLVYLSQYIEKNVLNALIIRCDS